MRRCTRCILPETFPGIRYDGNGVCSYCHTYEPAQVHGEKALERVLDRYRGEGKKYDCIAPVSGGRDSAYVLYQMVKKYNMRVLALTYDSGLIMPEGDRNLKRMVEVLGVDYVRLRNEPKVAVAKRNTQTKFRGWLKKPSINTIIPVLNSGDKTMNFQMAGYAHRNGIPLVLGGNIVGNATIEQDHWKTGFMGVFPDEHGVYTTFDKLRLVFLFGLEYVKNPYNFRLPILNEYLRGISVYFFESLFRPRDVATLGFYKYIYWDEEEIVSTITRELDWKGADDTTATWRIDDSAYPLINYLYYALVGFTEHDELYSKMIREGQITREKALERCLSDQQPRVPSLMASFEELGVTREEVDEAVARYRPRLLKGKPDIIGA